MVSAGSQALSPWGWMSSGEGSLSLHIPKCLAEFCSLCDHVLRKLRVLLHPQQNPSLYYHFLTLNPWRQAGQGPAHPCGYLPDAEDLAANNFFQQL